MQKRNLLGLLLSVAALSVMTGCASLPTPEAMKAETATFKLPKTPAEGKAMVYVVRPSSLGALVRFNVFVNDQEAASEMGFNRGSQYIYFSVPPGDHKIFSKAENWAEVTVSVKAGDIVFLHQDPAMGIIMARNNLTKVEEVQGKYYVKNSELGTILKAEK